MGTLAAAAAHFACLWLTPQQVFVWRDSFGLYEHAAKVTKDNHVMLGNLAVAFSEQGDIEKALALHHEALRIEPGDPMTHYNIGIVLKDLGQLDEALQHFTEAVRIYPRYVEAHVNLAWVLESKGQHDEAIRHYRAGHRIGTRKCQLAFPDGQRAGGPRDIWQQRHNPTSRPSTSTRRTKRPEKI